MKDNIVVWLHRAVSFAQIVDDICGKFDGLVHGAVCLFFDVPGYKKFKIRSVEMGGNCGVVDCTEDGGNDQDDIQNIGRDDQRDLLPTYCPNKGNTHFRLMGYNSAPLLFWIYVFVLGMFTHRFQLFSKGQRYGEMCSNAAESLNNWVSEARHLPITRLVDMIRVQIMEQMAGRRVKSMTWLSILCPKMEKLVATYNDSRPWCVSQANDDVYEIHSHPSVLVDMATRKCSCFQWQINGFPCSHAVVAFCNNGRNIYDSIDRAFHIETYRS
ncbi:hypothetical protein ACSBR1_004570 [Camellia fascicularis]